MSQENEEAVRRVYAEWERGNLQAVVALLDPEITYEIFMPDASENVVAHGLDEIEAFLRDWLAQWRDYRLIGDEFREVGTDKVFVAGRQAGTGQHSGAEVESPGFTVWTFRSGKVVKLVFQYDRDKALEAAGLRE